LPPLWSAAALLPLFLREAMLPALPLRVCRRPVISVILHDWRRITGKHGFPVARRKHGLRTPQTPRPFGLAG